MADATTPRHAGSMSRKVLAQIFLASSFITFLVTATQFSYDYREELGEVEQTLSQVESSYLNSVARSVWDMNESALAIQLNGIRSLPNVKSAQIREDGKGAPPAPVSNFSSLVREFKLVQRQGDVAHPLGTLVVVADLEAVHAKLYKKLLLIFLTQLFKTISVSSIIYWIVYRLMTRHLLYIAAYLEHFRLDSPQDLTLRRRNSTPGKEDEFDVLVSALNAMKASLVISHKELQFLNEKLREKVREDAGTISKQRLQIENSSKLSALGEMAGGVAHEINNPVSVIQMRAEQLREIAEEAGTIDRQIVMDTAQTISNTSTRIAKIVRGLKTFSRDGENDPFQKASVQAIIEETLDFCREKFRNSGVDLRVMAPRDPVLVECRQTQLSQVILNLLSNAFDAVTGLPEKWVRVDVSPGDQGVEIRITDSGRGIPPEILGKIMQPFFTTKEIGKGTGLGLSISQGIIGSHSGQIYVDQGSAHTCFVISLPKAQSRGSAA